MKRAGVFGGDGAGVGGHFGADNLRLCFRDCAVCRRWIASELLWSLCRRWEGLVGLARQASKGLPQVGQSSGVVAFLLGGFGNSLAG